MRYLSLSRFILLVAAALSSGGHAQTGDDNPLHNGDNAEPQDLNPNGSNINPANSRTNPDMPVARPKAKIHPKTKPKVVPSPRPAPPPAPAPIPVNESLKSSEQKAYEAEKSTQFNTLAEEIKTLRARAEALTGPKAIKARSFLSTAEGNRSAARTKLKQLKYTPPANWTILKVGIDSAFADLETAVQNTRAYIETP